MRLRRPLVIHIWLCNRSLLDFLINEANFFFQCTNRSSCPHNSVFHMSGAKRKITHIFACTVVYKHIRVPNYFKCRTTAISFKVRQQEKVEKKSRGTVPLIKLAYSSRSSLPLISIKADLLCCSTMKRWRSGRGETIGLPPPFAGIRSFILLMHRPHTATCLDHIKRHVLTTQGPHKETCPYHTGAT
jgi:hypothetical protein